MRPTNSIKTLALGLCAAGLSHTMGACAPSDDRTEDRGAPTPEEALAANPTSTVIPNREAADWRGVYREVVWATVGGGCTGTIVGPYAVLSAKHCGTNNGTVQSNGSSYASRAVHLNPYLDPSYTPDWWLSLNAAQQAAPSGRQDDWPAQHDQTMIFVPQLTPQFLAQRNIVPAELDPSLPANSYTIVGVGSTGGSFRDSMAGGFVAATPNTITMSPRDGYISRDATTQNLATATPGDSGGPTFGVQMSVFNGNFFEVRRGVFGTTQNPFDLAPLGFNIGVALTANQREAARLNALWARARADDVDGDGLPTACDSNPGDAVGSTSWCPAALGSPTGATTVNRPAALLECPLGYYATGLFGRSGDWLDAIGVHCRQLSCFASGCDGRFDTERFGGTGGGEYDLPCPDNEIMVGVGATVDPSRVYGIAPRCVPAAQVLSPSRPITQTTHTGNSALGDHVEVADCPVGRFLTGFQARSDDKRWTTGLQPICSVPGSNYTVHSGGNGGGHSAQSCPPGQVGVGVLTKMQDGSVNTLGIWCAERSLVASASVLSTTSLMLLRSGYHDWAQGVDVPSSIDRGNDVHMNGGTSTLCDKGFALQGMTVASDGSQARPLTGVASIQCRSLHSTTALPQTVAVNAGDKSNATYVGSTTAQVVDGLVARSGWLLDGVALHLSP
ncbi:MAG: hypothetical protein RLZZ450_2812 [Pseudomonadota bacterium]|jgi:hypothetical protein